MAKVTEAITARNIIDALIAISSENIWANELAFFSGHRRIDFFTLAPTRSQKFRATAYEIKISRADYARDSEEKQSGALMWSDRFWYVTPPGLLSKAEVPSWAGLQEWDGKSFSVRKLAPKRNKAEPDWEFVVSMLRNCGDSRRDTGLLKAQIGFLQSRVNEMERQQRMASEFKFRKWMAQSQALEASRDGE